MSENSKNRNFPDLNPSLVNKDKSRLLMNRRVWVIRDLFDKPRRQKDIMKLWTDRGEIQFKVYESVRLAGKGEIIYGRRDVLEIDRKIWKPKKFKDGIGISKSSLSKIFNGDYKIHTGLIDEGIVEKTFIEGETGYRLVETIEAFHKIMVEFSNSRLPKYYINRIRRELMDSDYANKLINKELVKNIQFYNESLNEEEENFIFIIIKISPSALLKICENVQSHWKPIKPENEKMNFIMDLQFLSYEDIKNQSITEKVASFQMPVETEFKIETSIKTGNNEFKHLSRFKKSSIELLSEEEQKEENEKIENMFGKFERES